MALLDRLINLEEPSLPVHQVCAAINLVKRGLVPAAVMKERFGLSDDEAQNLAQWVQSATVNRELVEDILRLGATGYLTRAECVALLT